MSFLDSIRESIDDNAIRAAESALERRDFARARSILQIVIGKGYRADYAWYLHAFATETPEQAAESLRAALKVNPKYRRAKNLLAKLTEIQKDEQAKAERLESARPSLSRGTFVGQDDLRRTLLDLIGRHKQSGMSLPHLLLAGPRHMGKAALAGIIAEEMGVGPRRLEGNEQSAKDLAATLTNLRPGDVLILEGIDEIDHGALKLVRDVALNFSFEIAIGKGTSVRNLRLQLPSFTLICTTEKPSRVDRDLARLLRVLDLRPYSEDDMVLIAELQAVRLGYDPDPRAIARVVGFSPRLPGITNELVMRLGSGVEDYESTVTRLRDMGIEPNQASSIDLAEQIESLDGAEFEEFVSDVYRELGFKVELVGQSGDHGIDLIAKNQEGTLAIQCKRWSGPVGEPVCVTSLGQ